MITIFKRKLHNLISDKKFSEILSGSAWALCARIISTGLAMITSIITARVYGAEVMGIVAMINSFLMLATIFTVLGTNTSILRLIPEHIAKYSPTSAFKVYRKTQYFVAGISVITCGLFFFESPFIAAKIFSKPNLSFFFALASIFIVFKSLVILNTNAVRGLKLIRTFAFMQILPAFSRLLILIVITVFFFNQYNPVYSLFASLTITALVGILIMTRKFKTQMATPDTIQDMPLKNIISVSWPMLMTATMNFTIGQMGVIMLGIFRSEAEVGYYSIAVSLATLTAFILGAINTMAAPRFSELFHTNKMGELFHIAKKSSKLIFWTSAPILLLLLACGKIILPLLYGEEFVQAYMALVFLLIGQFINSISGSTGIFMNMTGHEKKLKNIICISALINISLNLLLIPRYGIEGAAFGAMVSVIFWNIYILAYIKSKYGVVIGYMPILVKQ
jgi:O-antigen/teichoic acid export membrane protein